MTNWISIALAASFAAALSLAELLNARGRMPCLSSWNYVSARMVVDGGAGALAVPLVRGVFGEVAWFNPIWVVLMAGLCGPALLRSQLALMGSGDENPHWGPATIYRRLQKTLEDRIDEINASEERRWVDQIQPSLQHLPPAEFVREIDVYLSRLKSMKETQRRAASKYFKNILDEADTSDDEKRRAIVVKVIDLRGTRCIKDMLKDGSGGLVVAPDPENRNPSG